MGKRSMSCTLCLMVVLAFAVLRANPAQAVQLDVMLVEWSPFVTTTWELDCKDFAKAWTQAPGAAATIKQMANGHPSVAVQDNSPNAMAKAYANGCTMERRTAWIIDSASGWTAGAQASASRTLTVTNTWGWDVNVTFALVLLPEPVFTGGTGTAVGDDVIFYSIYEGGASIWESQTTINNWSSEYKSDSTGSLMWQKRIGVLGTEHGYLQTTQQVPVRTYNLNLSAGQSRSFNWECVFQTGIANASGQGTLMQDVLPEPGGLLALGGGLLSLAGMALRRRR